MSNSRDLDQQIEIRRNTPTKNAAAELVPSWSVLTTVWAADMSVTARETIRAGVVTDAPEYVFKIRNDDLAATVTNRDRVRWVTNGNLDLVVIGVSRMGPRHMYLRVSCRTLNPGEA